MGKETPIKIAYEVIMPWMEWGQAEPDIIYSKTAAKAKYQAALTWDCSENDWFKMKVRRAPAHDLFEPKPDECLVDIPEQQKQILAHANGNGTMSPGFRNYFFTNKDDADLLELVRKDLMNGPVYRHGCLPKGMAYFLLTEKGRSAAFSMMPRKRGDKQKIPGDQK